MCSVHACSVHSDVQVCVPGMLAGVEGECGVFSAGVLFLIALRQGLLLKKKHHPGWAGQLEHSQDESASSPCCWGCRHVQACVAFYHGYLGFKFMLSNLPHKPSYSLNHLPSSSLYSKDVGVCSSVFYGAMIWLCYQQHAGPMR